tara:strand:- start:89 stop:235 length:147 start_codon:yes stop_codon:yes gene_type:complete
MQIKGIIINILRYFNADRKTIHKNDLDAKYWLQNILLKNHLKSLNKNN